MRYFPTRICAISCNCACARLPQVRRWRGTADHTAQWRRQGLVTNLIAVAQRLGPRVLAFLAIVAASSLAGIGQDLQAGGDDARVLSAAIAHYGATQRNGSQPPLLVIATETIESNRILLGRFDRATAPEIPASIIEALRQRNAKAQPIGDIRLPANALLVRDAISMTRQVTPAGAEVTDWSPFMHAYPGSQLMQLGTPAYFTPGARALVYLWAGIGPEGTQGWLYILEKRGVEWQVTWSESPWIA